MRDRRIVPRVAIVRDIDDDNGIVEDRPD